MIRSEGEYAVTKQRIEEGHQAEQQLRETLLAEGYTEQQAEKGAATMRTFLAQLEDELRWYHNAKAGQFEALSKLTSIGRLLIAGRIARGMTQRQLALSLGVRESVVSRDEKNEYHGITVDRAQRILEVLRIDIKMLALERVECDSATTLEPEGAWSSHAPLPIGSSLVDDHRGATA